MQVLLSGGNNLLTYLLDSKFIIPKRGNISTYAAKIKTESVNFEFIPVRHLNALPFRTVLSAPFWIYFKNCFHAAVSAAEEDDIILLSPACAAFDHFKNFMERGKYYKELVAEL